MKVSIIIPVYKVEKEIERCLMSVMQQSYPNIEIVIINDCTPDCSFQIAKKLIYEKNFQGSTLFIEHGENQGLSCARNTGIKVCSGDYLFFLDSDDALSYKDAISDLIFHAQKNNRKYDVVMGNHQKMDDLGVFEVAHGVRRSFDTNTSIYRAYAKRRLWITAWGKLIDRKFLLDHNLFFLPGIYHEDELWSYMVFRCAARLYIMPKIVYDYHDRDGSIMSELKEKNIYDWIVVLEKMVEIFKVTPTYHKKETVVLIENYRRDLLEKITCFSDQDFKLAVLQKIKKIYLPMVLKGRVIKQQLILILPSKLLLNYLNYKFK